jgi:hypothetical protein
MIDNRRIDDRLWLQSFSVFFSLLSIRLSSSNLLMYFEIPLLLVEIPQFYFQKFQVVVLVIIFYDLLIIIAFVIRKMSLKKYPKND